VRDVCVEECKVRAPDDVVRPRPAVEGVAGNARVREIAIGGGQNEKRCARDPVAYGRDGAVEAIRALMVAKRSARCERTQTINQARAWD